MNLKEKNFNLLEKLIVKKEGFLEISSGAISKALFVLKFLEEGQQPSSLSVGSFNGILLRWEGKDSLLEVELTEKDALLDFYNNSELHESIVLDSLQQLKNKVKVLNEKANIL